ncbi:hypothetical protein CLV24_1478 [Pontibacter ummariensis]|uniref:DUF3945 domain-containing protein n=1 Tax=Pontibacter ummariensis TaxID=1610492 RepID=A0A239LM34_9BACT|nr:hypothetical protein [Pontibacter ummariensis]PRY02755.1 hypothetical protein CLV24_1478 [Pontibacter ummariensis]SNT30962.1 hypothetical protein SAMN06296052_1447 [Pontibacter ummariensis]
MNAKNLDYLKDGLRYLGFGTNLSEELEKNVRQQQPEFHLKVQMPYFKSQVDYTLHFRRSDQVDMYFFNKYDATLKPDNGEKDRVQTFYINKNSGITAREAYNLLNGRSVYKDLVNAEGQPYKAWLQLENQKRDQQGNHKVKQFHENYGFDLEKTLKQFAIKELSDPEKEEQLFKSLQKGNVQLITAVQDGQEVKRFVEASPQFKTINVYDERMKPLKRETLLRQDSKREDAVRKEQKTQQNEKKQDFTKDDQLEKKRPRKKGLSL